VFLSEHSGIFVSPVFCDLFLAMFAKFLEFLFAVNIRGDIGLQKKSIFLKIDIISFVKIYICTYKIGITRVLSYHDELSRDLWGFLRRNNGKTTKRRIELKMHRLIFFWLWLSQSPLKN